MDGISDAPVSASEIPDGFTADGSNNAKMAEAEAQKRQILEQIMTSDAFERLQRIKLVKKEKGEQVEMHLVKMATQGQLQSKIGEKQLIEMLEGAESTVKVKIDRRNYGLDSDDDDNDDDLY